MVEFEMGHFETGHTHILKFSLILLELPLGHKLILGLFQVGSSIMRLKSCIYIIYLLNASGKIFELQWLCLWYK